MPESFNYFSTTYYEEIICTALRLGYKFVTLSEFLRLGCPDKLHFVIRHDLDKQPTSLAPVIDSEEKMGVPSTTFIRLAGADYNFLSYYCFQQLQRLAKNGSELGLHTNFLEFASINKINPLDVLRGEWLSLKAHFNVEGVACHRDINYIHNSLPVLEENWENISKELGIGYQAYDSRIFSGAAYVNEGLNPHLCWRSPPEPVMETGKSIYMLTHTHWWFKSHPFEAP